MHDVTDFVGLTDYEGVEEAKKKAEDAASKAAEINKKELEFQRQQYSDWKDIYGTLQEQEADYIAKYSGEDVVAQQLGQASREYQTAEQQLSKTLAQRGLSGSGAEAAGLSQLAYQQAATRANIRSSQDDIAEQKRLNFLNLGLGQGTAMLGIQSGVSQAGVSAQTNIAGQQLGLASNLGAANMQAMGNIVQAGGQVAGGLAQSGFFNEGVKDD